MALAIGAAIGAALLVHLAFDAGPLHAASCYWEGGRDGWNIEYPPGLRTPADVEAIIRQETTCVAVEIFYVDYNEVPEGHLITEPCCRDWFALGDSATFWVEGGPDQAVEKCKLLEPDLAPRVDCPGGPVSGKPAPGQ